MSLLVQSFREKVSKEKDIRKKDESKPMTCYSTGFLGFDMRNGSIQYGKRDGKEYKYISAGIVDGTYNMIIGGTGTGKTTFVLQASGNIVRPFENSAIFLDDAEAASSAVVSRNQQLLGIYDPEEYKRKVIARNTGITAENLYERIVMIHDMKLAEPDKYMYDTGQYDMFGEKIYKLQPTVYILDSLMQLMPDAVTEEESLSGQMSVTSTAKTNAAIFRRIIPKLKAANIILFVINHILEDVNISIFKKKPDVPYLKQGERLPGGKTIPYLANNLIRFDLSSKLKSDEGFYIDGHIVSISFNKSRSNKAGKSVNMIFDQERGYDYDLSLYLLLKENKRIKGAGAYLYLESCPTIKFAQKQFKEKLMQHPELQDAFNKEVAPLLMEMVSEVTEEESERSVVSKNLFSMMNDELTA